MTRPADPSWLDAQYNNRARIPEHPQIFERWARDSLAARNALDARLDVPYGDGPNETLDVFPAARPGAPVLVFIHGGYWRSLDKADHSFVAEAFVDRGATVVVPNYALCPQVSIADIALQCARAVGWTWRHAVEHRGDPARIVVAGHSAGGHLAAMLLACRWPQLAPDLPPGLLRSALSVSGLFDLEPVRRTPFLQADLHLSPALVRRVSPAGFPAPAGRLDALVGALESDEFRRQNRLIREAWGEAVVPVCEDLPGLHHFTVLDSLSRPGGRAHDCACSMLGL